MSIKPAPSDLLQSIMSRKVIVVEASAPIKNALKIMIEKDIGSILVLDKGKPVGIITERDITKRFLQPLTSMKIYDISVKEIMSHPLITAKPDTPVWEAFEIMLRNKIRRLPIMDKDKLVGMVTERDLFRWVIRVAYEPDIPEKIKKLIER